MVYRIEIAARREFRDARGEHVLAQVRDFLGLSVVSVRTRDVYHVDADLTDEEAAKVVRELADPVLHRAAIGNVDDGPFDVGLRVSYKPGVADPVGRSARVAIEDTLGRRLEDGAAVYTSVLYLFEGIERQQAERIATELLANPVIHAIHVATWEEWQASPPDLGVPRIGSDEVPPVSSIDLSGSRDDLERISRDGLLALSLAEMEAIRDHFASAAGTVRRREAGLGSSPTDVELECLAQTWSEHCKHKIFNATIDYREEGEVARRIESLFKTYIRGATETVAARQEQIEGRTWLRSVFHDNAGVIAFDDHIHLVYKVETHNSPSALDPYGGAMTGIVGVNRDPFGTGRGADLLVNVWGYCFASPFHQGELPKGLLHPKRIRDGVHAGVIDGGNQSGIPYGRGWEIFDGRYLGKPLVFCGTVGALPVEIVGKPGEEKYPQPGDAIVMVGGRIGADGIHGATFSSAALDESSPTQAVQIGDPITQKMMFDFLLEARDLGLFSAITDNGAGGLSSSVGEMARAPGGARLDLAQAPLKYAGLAAWEIFLSEAQERMTVAVRPDCVEAFLDLAKRREVEATVLGSFTDDGFLEVLHGTEAVALLEMDFLHEGAPDMQLAAVWSKPKFSLPRTRPGDHNRSLLDMMGRLNLASNEAKARHYDHEVKGLTVIKPFVGVHTDVPAEATVFLARHGSFRGFALSEGINPFLSDLDTRAMAMAVVDEAVRRLLCAGARLDRIAALDNFCWPDPIRSDHTPDGQYKLAQLVRACEGLYDACVAYGVPLISGKDSMKNESMMGGVKICVPPTLLISAIGQIDDVRDALTLDPKEPGDTVFLLGECREELGGSEYLRYLGDLDGVTQQLGEPAAYVGDRPPSLDTAATWPLYTALHEAIRQGLVRSAAAPGRGGLAACLARCVLASDLGLDLDLQACAAAAGIGDDGLLFAESNGRFVVTVAPADTEHFSRLFTGLPCTRIGAVSKDRWLIARRGDSSPLAVEIDALRHRFHGGLSDA